MPEVNLELELIRACIPFPWVDSNGELRNGLIFEQPKICFKCNDKVCKSFSISKNNEEVAHFVCPRGISVIVFKFPFGNIVSNGLIEMTLNKSCKPAIRKKYRTQKFQFASAEKWSGSVRSAASMLNAMLETRINESIQSLHDIVTAVRLVRSCATRIIQQYPGGSDDEKIESSPNDMKALFKSVLLLGRRLEMSSIIANPESAGFGQKKPTPIYKVFDLICRLFEEVAHWDGSKHIHLFGSSFKTPPVYTSFETLALILIDNAVKYCERGGTVNVSINDLNYGVSVSVENPGSLVPESYRNNIFDKGFRTPIAKSLHSAGRGFGLYIANIIAKVNDFQIEYFPLRTKVSSDVDFGINAFKFIVPD